MTDMPNNVAPAGWYVDPMTRRHLRWWNGQAWTESVAPLPGVAPAASVAPAPRVQQRFALGASDEQTQAAATQTQTSAARFTETAQPFVAQVPETLAQQTQQEQPAVNVQPAIPWPAVKPTEPAKPTIEWPDDADTSSSPASASQAASHYTPQYGAVTGSGGATTSAAETPNYHRTQSGPVQLPTTPSPAASTGPVITRTENDESAGELESTIISRRQLRDRKAAQLPEPPTTPPPAMDTDDSPDVWAGHDDRHADQPKAWEPHDPRASRNEPEAPYFWSTVSIWLLTITPWLFALAGFVALALFDAWSLPAIGVMLLPWLIGLLFAQQDATRLRELGHTDVASPLWAALTAPVYLIVHTLAVRRELGTGAAPLAVWALNAVVVAIVAGTLAFAPEIAPTFAADAFEPLRATAVEWLRP